MFASGRHDCSGAGAARTPSFRWVNTALGNIKAAIVGTYRAIDQKHVPRYLAEFEYRFNRRYDLAAMRPRLAWSGSGRLSCRRRFQRVSRQ